LKIASVKIFSDFIKDNKIKNGIVGIFPHSIRKNIQTRPINLDIIKEIKRQNCVVCGSISDIVCDHKNDLYNNKDVLLIENQTIDDFQPLCNHCNLQKRQIAKEEKREYKLYSAKSIKKYQIYPFEFPWEKKAFDLNDINCKKDTFWYDPIEFHRKIKNYINVLYMKLELYRYFINKKYNIN
jgi:hypothetical protein